LKIMSGISTLRENPKFKNLFLTFGRFLGVGLSGIAVNLAVLWVFVSAAVVPFLASLLATEISIIWNFFLHDYWTFKEKGRDASRASLSAIFSRFIRFQLVSSLGAGLSIGLFVLFNSGLHLFYVLAQIGAIGLTTIVNFTLNAWLTWEWFKGSSPGYMPIEQLAAENNLDTL